ncbi:MAG: nucleotidyltransferase domain-containing protein [Acidobacteriota bacterium]|jgi:predicted nucleotidyltransferase|nr:nucleotidyltransferase domain-containing protein [Acidobacteriota bacterium]
MNIGISKDHKGRIIDTLIKHGVSRAVVFGSRAKGDWHENSDIDIAVFGDVNIGALSDELEELPIPNKFDVIGYESITHVPLREHIDRVGIEIYARESKGTSRAEKPELSTVEDCSKSYRII